MPWFKSRLFLLDIGFKLSSSKDISDCFHRDRVVNDDVDVFGSICGIFSLSSDDRADNLPLIQGGEFPRTSSYKVLLVWIYFFLNFSNLRLGYTSFPLDLSSRMTFFKVREDI